MCMLRLGSLGRKSVEVKEMKVQTSTRYRTTNAEIHGNERARIAILATGKNTKHNITCAGNDRNWGSHTCPCRRTFAQRDTALLDKRRPPVVHSRFTIPGI
ncbi:unnamed protein product [Mycena citricolor]|uniref:Uncharacterized protein n=1 Tax=Mycena citricolor TaxID=2018698 RepID=A0AAD2GU13_9AGAR|nr:unnamed protein product [Mycena citricolor]